MGHPTSEVAVTRNRKRLVRFIAASMAAAAAGLLSYTLLFGSLFPLSPVIIGFERSDLENAVVYTQKGHDFGDLRWMDTVFGRVEEFHALQFTSRPRIFLFGDDRTYARRSISRARLCAFYNGTIVVSPWLSREDAAGTVSLETYIEHELSHVLLFQNLGIPASMRYPKWLLEGVATLGSGQMGTPFYPDSAETVRLIAAGNWMPPEVFGTDSEDGVSLGVENRMPFVYCEFALIVDDLIDRFGRERFQEYMTGHTFWSDPDGVFERTYGMKFEDYLSSFRSDICH